MAGPRHVEKKEMMMPCQGSMLTAASPRLRNHERLRRCIWRRTKPRPRRSSSTNLRKGFPMRRLLSRIFGD